MKLIRLVNIYIHSDSFCDELTFFGRHVHLIENEDVRPNGGQFMEKGGISAGKGNSGVVDFEEAVDFGETRLHLPQPRWHVTGVIIQFVLGEGKSLTTSEHVRSDSAAAAGHDRRIVAFQGFTDLKQIWSDRSFSRSFVTTLVT